MNKLLRTLTTALAAFTLMVITAPSLHACASCMGAADEHIGPALNASMGVLLGLTGMALGSIIYFFIYLARRDGLPLTPQEQ